MRHAAALWLWTFCVIACGSDAGDAPREAVLRVGTSGDYVPFSSDGEGFDVEVAALLARELGARVEWVPFRWPELSADLAADRGGSIDPRLRAPQR